jgi:hypothetical protein
MDNIVKKVKLYQMKGQTTWNEGTEAAYRSWLSSMNLADGGIWEDQDEDGETKSTLSFKGIVLRT